MKKSKEANWPSGVVNWGRFSSLKRLESIFVRGVRIILFIMEKSFELYSSSFLDIGTKFKPLWWFSGRILACHAGGPGSIPGQCKLSLCHYFIFVYRPNVYCISTLTKLCQPLMKVSFGNRTFVLYQYLKKKKHSQLLYQAHIFSRKKKNIPSCFIRPTSFQVIFFP